MLFPGKGSLEVADEEIRNYEFSFRRKGLLRPCSGTQQGSFAGGLDFAGSLGWRFGRQILNRCTKIIHGDEKALSQALRPTMFRGHEEKSPVIPNKKPGMDEEHGKYKDTRIQVKKACGFNLSTPYLSLLFVIRDLFV